MTNPEDDALHKMDEQKKLEVNDALIDRIYTYMANDAATFQDACLMCGVTVGRMKYYCRGEDAKNPEWRHRIDTAYAFCRNKWLKILEKGGTEKNQAMVKSAEKMLFAIDRDRFREVKGAEGGIQLFVVQGDPNQPLPIIAAQGLLPTPVEENPGE